VIVWGEKHSNRGIGRRVHIADQGGCQEQKGPGTILGRTVNGWAVMGGIDKTPECCVVSS
jgi:hypothetical protein